MFINNDEYALGYPAIFVDLKGGFCLLSRLKHLQSLRVVEEDFNCAVLHGCSKANLTWIVPSGRRDKYKRERQGEMATWREMRDQEDQLEAARPSPSPVPLTTLAEADAEIWFKLQHLGLLLDVEEMVKEIDSEDFESLPSLQRIAFMDFRPPKLRQIEEEFDRNFPAKFDFRGPIVAP